jgi:oligosaccharide:H+ symporter
MKNKSAKAIGYNLLLVNAFVYLSASLYTPFLSTFYSSNGINSIEIGILLTIAPVAAILIQPLWAMLSDRSGRRKFYLSLVVLGSGLAIFSYYLGNTFTTYFIATVLLSLFTTSIIPLSDAIIIRDAGRINFEFAVIRMGGTLGFALMVPIAGWILKTQPNSLFFMGSLGYMALLFFVLRLQGDQEAQKSKKTRELPLEYTEKVKGILSIFNTKMIFFVLAFALISQIGFSFYWSFLGVYVFDLGYGQSTVGWLNCVSALSEVPTLLIINRLIKKFGPLKILFASCLILGLRLFLVTMGSLTFIVLAQLIQGISYMTIYFSCAVYINNNVKPGKQSQGQSSLAIVQTGIGSIIGNIAGGYLVDILGITPAYGLMSSVMIVAAFITLVIQVFYERKQRMAIR